MKQSVRVSTILVAATLISFALLLPTMSHGAPDYSVSPFVLNKELQPRDIFTETITIKNNDTVIVEVFPIVMGVSVGPEGGIEEFVPASMSDRTTSLTSWLEINRLQIRVNAGETKEIPLTFRVNPNAKPGTYHAFIGFARGTNVTEAEQLVKSGRSPGVVINATIEDGRSEVLKLSGFLINKFILSPSPDDIKYVVENTGDTTIEPSGDILIYNHKGEEVGAVPLNPERVIIDPGEKHVFTAPIPADGLLGKYKAFMTLQYGSEQLASVNDTTFFYVLPWLQIAIVFGVLAVASVIISLLVHKRYLAGGEAVVEYDQLPVSLKDSASNPKEHDLDMKKRDDW